MPPRDLVGSIGGQDERSLVLERDGQPVEQVQGFRVGTMQVIEEHHRRAVATDLVEGPPDGFHQRLLVRPFRHRAELGKEQREVPFEGSNAPQAVGHGPQVRTQHADDRSVRRAFRRGRPSQDEELAAGESVVRKSGLPHSCLARDQDEPAFATPNLGQDIRQRRKLCFSADQLDLVGHRCSVWMSRPPEPLERLARRPAPLEARGRHRGEVKMASAVSLVRRGNSGRWTHPFSVEAPLSWRSIPHLGHRPGVPVRISGCIGHI